MIELIEFSIALTDYGFLCFGVVDSGKQVESITFFKPSIRECQAEFEAQVMTRFDLPFSLDTALDNRFSEN